MARFSAVAIVGLMLVLVPFSSAQQLDTVVIVGTVSDASGAVIPGVNVTFSHVATGTTYLGSTNEEGSYRSNPPRIGEHLVIAESDGFCDNGGPGVLLSICQAAGRRDRGVQPHHKRLGRRIR